MKVVICVGRKNRIAEIQTERQGTQSNGLILLWNSILNPFLIAFGIPAM
jgi:hypothetical protein